MSRLDRVLEYGELVLTGFFVMVAALVLVPIAATGREAFTILLAGNLLVMVLAAKLVLKVWRDIHGEG